MIIHSRQQTPKDSAEAAQLALFNFFREADTEAKRYGLGGLQRLDIQVVDGQFSLSWTLGHDRHRTTFQGNKIEDWADLSFLPATKPYTEADE